MWDTQFGKVRKHVHSLASAGIGVSWHRAQLIVGEESGVVRFYNAAKGEALYALTFNAPLLSIDWNPQQELVCATCAVCCCCYFLLMLGAYSLAGPWQTGRGGFSRPWSKYPARAAPKEHNTCAQTLSSMPPFLCSARMLVMCVIWTTGLHYALSARWARHTANTFAVAGSAACVRVVQLDASTGLQATVDHDYIQAHRVQAVAWHASRPWLVAADNATLRFWFVD